MLYFFFPTPSAGTRFHIMYEKTIALVLVMSVQNKEPLMVNPSFRHLIFYSSSQFRQTHNVKLMMISRHDVTPFSFALCCCIQWMWFSLTGTFYMSNCVISQQPRVFPQGSSGGCVRAGSCLAVQRLAVAVARRLSCRHFCQKWAVLWNDAHPYHKAQSSSNIKVVLITFEEFSHFLHILHMEEKS